MAPEAVEPGAVIYDAGLLEEGDQVELARSDYDWASPLDVVDAEVTEWLDDDGATRFTTASVQLTTGRGQPHLVAAVDGESTTWRQGVHEDVVTQFDPIEPTDDPSGGEDQAQGDEAAEEFLERVDQTSADCVDDDPGDEEGEDVAFDETVAVDEPDSPATDDEDGLERDYADDMIVDDLSAVSAVRHRSMRQQVRAAPDDVDDEELAVKIGATVEVARRLRVQAADIEARKHDTGSSTAARVPCENCGNDVSQRYARVFSPDDDPDSVQCCPACPDMIRDHDGEVREARSSRSSAKMVDAGGGR